MDAAAEKALSAEGYREIRRDYVVNRAAGAALERCGLVPALTPDVHVLTYPEAGSAFGFSLSVVERPRLALSSYGPVEVEMERMEVTDGLVDARIADFLEAHAAFDEAPPRPVRRGDCIKVDVMTTLDGKTVPRLTGNGMLLELVPGRDAGAVRRRRGGHGGRRDEGGGLRRQAPRAPSPTTTWTATRPR